MDLKEKLISQGYDRIDIFLIDEEKNQETIADITLHKVTDLEYKLYLEPDSIAYELDEENPYFTANQKTENGGYKEIKGFILEW
ncbi:hypothetical protein LF817_12985 [Halobacillus sp. A1]|uniref:hypothetical protein n=1 Tax=Halobacillus sp. A1 TaxID=2880262 RepID=UPI0020A69738|nr:hypothetical protein [Halobacillus sp. A1]MCP3032257.1 hypothetical protein [Halobacillus sp. A1]